MAPIHPIEKAEKLLSRLSRAEKASILQWIVSDLGGAFPGIDSTPAVAGGEPRIVRTRIPVWVLVQARKLGTSEADILRCYPRLRAEDLVSAWAYYRSHPEEIEAQIRENETAPATAMHLADTEGVLDADRVDRNTQLPPVP